MKKRGFTAEQIIGNLKGGGGSPQLGSHSQRSQPKAWHHGADVLLVEEGVWRDAGRAGPEAQGT